MEVSHSTHSDNLDISLTSIIHNVIFFAFVTVLFCTPVCRYGLSMLPYLPCYECSNFHLFSPFLCHSFPVSLYLALSSSISLSFSLFLTYSIPLFLFLYPNPLSTYVNFLSSSLLRTHTHEHSLHLSIHLFISLSICLSIYLFLYFSH